MGTLKERDTRRVDNGGHPPPYGQRICTLVEYVWNGFGRVANGTTVGNIEPSCRKARVTVCNFPRYIAFPVGAKTVYVFPEASGAEGDGKVPLPRTDAGEKTPPV